MQKDSLLFFLICFIISILSDSQSSQCNAYCQTMVYYDCTICVNDCTGQTKLTMISCNQTYCENYAQHGCISYKSRTLDEPTCTQSCCDKPSFTFFTRETLSQCLTTNNDSQSKRKATAITIISCVVSFIGFLIIFNIIFACVTCCRKTYNNRNQPNQPNQNQIIANNQQNNQGQRIIPHENNDRNYSIRHNDTFQSLEKRNPVKCVSNQSWVQDRQLSKKQKSSQDQSQANQVSCPICLESYCECQTDCKHMFHFICLEEWTKRHRDCPICRSRNLDPFKIYCTTCRKKYFNYVYKEKNDPVTLALVSSKKLICDKCQKKQRQSNIQG